MPKLIVLRGNSGSGKSTVAKEIRQLSEHKIAIVEQDYVRRTILKEKERPGGDNIDLIRLVTEYALEHGYNVILEGILHFEKYGKMLGALAKHWPEHYFFYFDIPLAETIKRHATKPNAHEFGETEMTAWYHSKDLTNFAGETIIPERSLFDKTVQQIIKISGL